MKDKIMALHAGDVKKALPEVVDKPFSWLYLGQSVEQRESIAQLLGKEHRYTIGSLLQEVARKEKQPFLDFIAGLGLQQKNRHHWWASYVSYKCPLVNNFFLLWCYAAVFKEVCFNKKPDDKKILVFVEDRWLYRYLWQKYGKKGGNLEFPSRKNVIPELVRLVVRGIFYRAYFINRVVRQILRQRKLSADYKKSGLSEDKPDVCVFTWVRDRFFTENGEFESPYFGRLPQILSEHGFNVSYVAELFLTPSLSSRCLEQGQGRFILLDRYIDFWIMARCVISFFRISSYQESPLRILLLREIAYEFLSTQGRTLDYFVFKKWLKDIKRERITIIYPFENQPWEKLLCLAAQESGKDIKLIGYQHSIVPPMLLNYFLGAGEAGITPLPSLIVANGEHTCNLLGNAGYGDTQIVNGGALRYGYMHQADKGSVRKEETFKTVLVALSYSRSLSEELLISLFNVFGDFTGKDVRFVIKFHPEAPPESLTIKLPEWPTHFHRTDGNMADILKEIDLVIYSSSTVGLEALLSGVPVVRYYSEHAIDLDPLAIFDETTVKSCAEDSMKQVVLSALNEGSHYKVQELASEAGGLNRFFSPVNEALWTQIVKN